MLVATMKRNTYKTWLALAIAMLTGLAKAGDGAETNFYSSLGDAERDNLSYAIGINEANNLLKVLKRIEIEDHIGAVVRGFSSRLMGKPEMSDEEVQKLLSRLDDSVQEGLKLKHQKEGSEFKDHYGDHGGKIDSTYSGLIWKVLKAGSGDKPKTSDTVVVNYKVSKVDGTVIVNTFAEGHPSEFALTNVVKGWQEALQLMPKGSHWEIVIPYQLAYGDVGWGSIGPGETLVFETELVNFFPTPASTSGKAIQSTIVEVPSAEAVKKGAEPRVLTEEDIQKEKQKEAQKTPSDKK